jgi:8-oxo-dGTP pyrophosphatase MutT (NUDIX family)
MRQYGPWRIKSTAEKYGNEHFRVQEDQVIQPDGESGIYGTIHTKPGVAILVKDETGDVFLTKQFRYSVGKDSVELVTGAIDSGESPLQAAQREVREEIGMEAVEWQELGVIDLDTSIVKCPIHLFVATASTFIGKEQEGTEQIETVKYSFDDALNMALRGEITHAPSCTLLFKYKIMQHRLS